VKIRRGEAAIAGDAIEQENTLRRKVLHTVTSQNKLGVLLTKQTQYQEAEKLYESVYYK
jgi:hypothetical protein